MRSVQHSSKRYTTHNKMLAAAARSVGRRAVSKIPRQIPSREQRNILYDAVVSEGLRRLFSGFFSTPSASTVTTTNNWRILSPSFELNVNIDSTWQIVLLVVVGAAVVVAVWCARKKIRNAIARLWGHLVRFW